MDEWKEHSLKGFVYVLYIAGALSLICPEHWPMMTERVQYCDNLPDVPIFSGATGVGGVDEQAPDPDRLPMLQQVHGGSAGWQLVQAEQAGLHAMRHFEQVARLGLGSGDLNVHHAVRLDLVYAAVEVVDVEARERWITEVVVGRM